MKIDSKKKSPTISELNIIKGYLFRGRLTDHSPLHREQEQKSAARRERDHMLYISIYRIRGHAQVTWYLKGYWLKEFLQYSSVSNCMTGKGQ